MKALYFEEHGDIEVIKYGDVPDPDIKAEEVLVKVGACGLNHLDIWVRKGLPGIDLKLPHWGGADIAGEIVETGSEVTGWEKGQRVVVDPGINTREDEFTRRGEPTMSPGYQILGEQRPGGMAEYIAVPAGNLLLMPVDLDYPEAAAPLLVSLTAWRMLINRAGLRAGESVLIVGAGGGVNSMAIQVAKIAGAYVYVVAGDAEKAESARQTGADVVMDRTQVDWGKMIFKVTQKRGVNVVVDNVGRETLKTSMKAAARGGRIVIVGNTSGAEAQIDIRYIFGKQISLIGSTMGTHQDFIDVTGMLWSGKLKPVIDRVLPLKQGKDAYRILEQGNQFGKVVLKP